MAWMAWTWPTATFFACIALALIVMTVAELRWPSSARRGWLPMATTRGDRFFIALLSAAGVHILWLATADLPVALAALPSLGFAMLVMARG